MGELDSTPYVVNHDMQGSKIRVLDPGFRVRCLEPRV